MSQEPQDHSPARNNSTDVEHQPRTTTEAIAVPEIQSDAASAEPPQTESYVGQQSAIHPATSESPRSFEHPSDQPDAAPTRETSHDMQLNSAGTSLPEDISLEENAAVAATPQPDHNVVDVTDCTNERLSPQVEREFLDKIRDEVLYAAGATEEGHRRMRDMMNHYYKDAKYACLQDGVEIIVPLVWGSRADAAAGIEAARAEQSILHTWPEDRYVVGVEQLILESDGCNPAIEPPWSSVQKVYQDEGFAIGEEPDTDYSLGHYYGYESLWHSWCFATRKKIKELNERQIWLDVDSLSRPQGKITYCCLHGFKKGVRHCLVETFASMLSYDEPFSKLRGDWKYLNIGYSATFLSPKFQGGCVIDSGVVEKNIIHWKIRYFSPAIDDLENMRDSFLSKRQTATIRYGSKTIRLAEKRVRISFRVLKGAPGLFSILVLADYPIAVLDGANSIEETKSNWERYGLKATEKAIPITHYLFEICSVFEGCMSHWGKALDAIDGLVHVELEDFDDQSRVEDLMFDKSFERSKDYFVALQLLRIADEWLDEVLPGLQELQKYKFVSDDFGCGVEAQDNFDAAIRSIDEQAAVVQKRIRKKVDEINSLRDGLFNATSLRESTKAMALNQAIYVFTVITVLFTPVSFLAVRDILCQFSLSQLIE